MALVADGSRIANLSRVASAAINADFTLTSRTQAFIYAGGVDLTAGDRWRAGTGTSEWYWRRVGGTFAAVGNRTEVSFGAATVLVQGTGLTNANKLTTQTATSTSAALAEVEGTAGPVALLLELRDDVSGEGQVALSVLWALASTQYEMMMRCVHDAGTTDVTFAAKFTTGTQPLLLPDYSKFTSPELVDAFKKRSPV